MALIIGTWFWGHKYSTQYISRLRDGVSRNHLAPYRFAVFQPRPGDEALKPGCLCRLRMFSPSWQREQGIREGDRIVCLDLDLIVTGPIAPLFDRPEKFVIFAGANAANPCPFNGSVMMLRAGAYAEVWNDFSLERAQTIPFYEFPDDQGWLWQMIPDAATWPVGPTSGIYAFRKPAWPANDQLPSDARMVAFPGKRDPSMFINQIPWIKNHWASATR